MNMRRCALVLVIGALLFCSRGSLMAANIGDIRSKVTARIKDAAAKLTTTAETGDVDLAIKDALEQYSKDRPRDVVVQRPGDGGFDYLLTAANFPGYIDGGSIISEVVYPYQATDQGFEALDADDWEIVRLPGQTVPTLRFLGDKPKATENFLVYYTRAHSLDGTQSTLPATDDEAFADLAASCALEQLAAFYAQSTDATITADAVDHRTKSAEYRALAERLRKHYEQKLGIGDQPAIAAGTHVELDRAFSDVGKTDYFFHGRRRF